MKFLLILLVIEISSKRKLVECFFSCIEVVCHVYFNVLVVQSLLKFADFFHNYLFKFAHLSLQLYLCLVVVTSRIWST